MKLKKRLEERWEMVRWISEYISKNQEGWERGETVGKEKDDRRVGENEEIREDRILEKEIERK